MKFFAKTAGAVACLVMAQTATAAVFTYDLSDNGTAGFSNNGHLYSYGLRLDSWRGMDYMLTNDYTDSMMIFSFDAGSSTLVYDDVAGTARIEGTMRRSLADGSFGDVATLSYEMSGVDNVGYGQFVDRSTTGTIGTLSYGGFDISLGRKDRRGDYFLLTDSSNREDDTGLMVGEGWVNYFANTGCCDDFLFNAELVDVSQVPLPAAGWMLIAAVGGVGAMARRKNRA